MPKGVYKHKKKTEYADNKHQVVLDLWKDGCTGRIITQKTGVPLSTVHYWCSGIKRPIKTRVEKTSLFNQTHSVRLKNLWKDEEYRRKMTEMNSGENSAMWKKENISYRGIHHWVVKKLGLPHDCSFCSNKSLKHRQYQWANISGNYERNISDWIRLCVSCHKKFDSYKPKH